MIMLHADLKNQKFQEKYRHLFILHGLFVSRIGLSLHTFRKCVTKALS